MKFMTPATVRNLPSYMAQQQRQSLLQRDEERYQEQQDKRKMTAQAGFELMETLDNIKSPDDFQSAMKTWGAKWKPVLGPEGLQMTSNMVRNFKESQYQKEDRQKQLLSEQTAGADADAASRILGQKAGFINQNSAGGDDYSVPVSQEDLLLSMSPKGRLGMTQTLLGHKLEQEKAESQAKKDALDMRYKEAQIQNLGKRQEATPMSYREWQLAGEPGTYEQWVNRNRTVGNEDTARADLEAKYDVYENTITVPKDQAQAVLRDVEASGFTAVPGKEIKQDKPGWFTGDDELVEIKIGGYHGTVQQGQPGSSEPQTEAPQGGAEQASPVVIDTAKKVYTEITSGNEQGAVDMLLGELEKDEQKFKQIMLLFPVDLRRAIWEKINQTTATPEEAPQSNAAPAAEKVSKPTPNNAGLLLPGIPGAIKKTKDVLTDKSEWQKMVDFANQQSK